jgi:hypothetical protein
VKSEYFSVLPLRIQSFRSSNKELSDEVVYLEYAVASDGFFCVIVVSVHPYQGG